MKYKTMGLFAGALKRVKNSLGHIAKNAGNFITLAGKSKIPGLFAPTGLGSFVNKSLEKLGKSVYDTGSYMRGEINGDQYLDSLAETNKYGAVFGPYNFYKTIKEHGFKDGSKMRRTAKKSDKFRLVGFFYPSRQAWYIITRQRVYHQHGNAVLYLITPSGVYFCRLDDIQLLAKLMICNSYGIDDIQGFALIFLTPAPNFKILFFACVQSTFNQNTPPNPE